MGFSLQNLGVAAGAGMTAFERAQQINIQRQEEARRQAEWEQQQAYKKELQDAVEGIQKATNPKINSNPEAFSSPQGLQPQQTQFANPTTQYEASYPPDQSPTTPGVSSGLMRQLTQRPAPREPDPSELAAATMPIHMRYNNWQNAAAAERLISSPLQQRLLEAQTRGVENANARDPLITETAQLQLKEAQRKAGTMALLGHIGPMAFGSDYAGVAKAINESHPHEDDNTEFAYLGKNAKNQILFGTKDKETGKVLSTHKPFDDNHDLLAYLHASVDPDKALGYIQSIRQEKKDQLRHEDMKAQYAMYAARYGNSAQNIKLSRFKEPTGRLINGVAETRDIPIAIKVHGNGVDVIRLDTNKPVVGEQARQILTSQSDDTTSPSGPTGLLNQLPVKAQDHYFEKGLDKKPADDPAVISFFRLYGIDSTKAALKVPDAPSAPAGLQGKAWENPGWDRLKTPGRALGGAINNFIDKKPAAEDYYGLDTTQ
jgi:hypothetical protein